MLSGQRAVQAGGTSLAMRLARCWDRRHERGDPRAPSFTLGDPCVHRVGVPRRLVPGLQRVAVIKCITL